MHRLQLRHANSEFTELGGSIGSESFQTEGSPYSTVRNLGLKSANNSNRSSGGRYIETTSSRGGVEMIIRPQSALAGTIGSSRSPERKRAIASGSVRGEHQTRSKTTRVRINSTSEQIQDPNWLIRMSRELELQQQSKKSHLKSLHRKLKLTITGHHPSSSPSADSNSNLQAQGLAANAINNGGNNDSNNNNNNSANNSDISNREAQDNNKLSTSTSSGSAFSVPPVPQKPIKVPVSILKQRTVSSTTTPTSANNSPAFNSKQNQQYFKISSNRTKTPVQVQNPSSISKPASKSANNKQQKQAQSHSASSVISPVTSTSTPASVAFQTDLNNSDKAISTTSEPTKQKQATQQQQQQQQESSTTTPKPAPICADGQVKVSGWKRNNLLAKTLSHFDEIRGNQRPIFVPTKITLPPESLGQGKHMMSSATAALATTVAATITDPASSTNMPSFRPGKSKFAEIVREAVSKKNQLIASSSKQPLSDSAKRASYGGANDHSAGDSSKELSHHANTRAISAEPSVVIHNPTHHQPSHHQGQVGVGPPGSNLTQHRSSSTGTRESFGSASPTLQLHTLSNQSSKQQQVMGKRQSGGFSGGGGSSPKNSHPTMHVSPKLVSQLLISNAVNSGLSEASSSRAFKLQHKNQQVLQHLKHHLDPESSSHAHQHNQAGNASNSTHIKDWKRLTSKLSLLTSSRNFSKSSSSATPSKNLLTVKDDSVLIGDNNSNNSNQSGSTNGATPLRLTVSNQESGKSGAHHDGNVDGEKHASNPFSLRFLQTKRNSNSQQNSPSSVLQLPETGPRKLSSSSMVVQSSSGDSCCCNNKTGIGAAASVGAACGGARDAQTTCRRSSDSEAYRVSSGSSPEPKHTHSPSQSSSRKQSTPERGESKRGSAISLLSSISNNSEKGTNKQPVVVYRNDLLQLLQVTARPANGNRRGRQQRGSTNSNDDFDSTKESNEFSDGNLSWSIKNKHRHSLQLNDSSQVTKTETTTTPTKTENESSKVNENEGENKSESRSAELISFSEAKMDKTKRHAGLPRMGRSTSMNSVEFQLVDFESVQNKQDKQFNKMAVRSSLSDSPMVVAGCATTIKQPPGTTKPAVSLLGQHAAEAMRDLGEDSKEKVNEKKREVVNDEDLCQNQTTKSMSLLQRSSDLSWVVKKTSKVAFFQQKLRKMRWHSKQQKHSDSALGGNSGTTSETTTAATTTLQNQNRSNITEQWPQIASVNQNKEKQLACQPEAITTMAKNEDHEDGDSNDNDLETSPSDVFMDPTLIGDAIEIFLRNTMQQQQQQQQRKGLRRESTGETPTKKVGVPGSEMD